MLIGVISDTHDRVEALQKAIAEFNKRKVGAVFHCGDWSSFYMPTFCDNLDCEVFSVLGNNDTELVGYRKKTVGKVSFCGENFLEKEIGGQKIAVCHGDTSSLLTSLLDSGKYDVVFSGHTHKSSITKTKNTLHVNPGTPFYSRTNEPSIAIYDTETSSAEIIAL